MKTYIRYIMVGTQPILSRCSKPLLLLCTLALTTGTNLEAQESAKKARENVETEQDENNEIPKDEFEIRKKLAAEELAREEMHLWTGPYPLLFASPDYYLKRDSINSEKGFDFQRRYWNIGDQILMLETDLRDEKISELRSKIQKLYKTIVERGNSNPAGLTLSSADIEEVERSIEEITRLQMAVRIPYVEFLKRKGASEARVPDSKLESRDGELKQSAVFERMLKVLRELKDLQELKLLQLEMSGPE